MRRRTMRMHRCLANSSLRMVSAQALAVSCTLLARAIGIAHVRVRPDGVPFLTASACPGSVSCARLLRNVSWTTCSLVVW